MSEHLDIIIKKGNVVDGTGKDMYKADIGIKDERIIHIGDLEGWTAEKVIEAEGMIVSPGFIDVHSHGEATVLLFPEAQSALGQGITTIVGGNCGISPAPLKDYWLMAFWEFDFWNEVEPYTFYEDPIKPIDKVKKVLNERFDLDVDWQTFGEFLEKVESRGTSANIVPLVGHGQIRAQVMGKDSSRLATSEEIDRMKDFVREAMESGAYGMSTGLDYAPGAYANTEELIDLAKVVKQYDGIYATHWRRTGVRRGTPKRPKKIKGVEEAVEIGKKADIKVQISHLITGYEIYPEPPAALQRASAQATLDVIDQAVNDGVDVAFDVIPNTSGGIGVAPYLITAFLPWVRQAGSIDQFVTNLKAHDYRAYIKEFITSGKWYSINPKVNPDWDKSITVCRSINKLYQGKSIGEIADGKGIDALDLLFELLAEDPYVQVKASMMSDEGVKVFLKHHRSMVCTDAFFFDDKGVWGQTTEIPRILPHPNTYCAFVRYLLNYGEDRLEDKIRRITGFPADWFELVDRGYIKEGAYADVCVFDLNGLETNENHIEPRNYPDGIKHVIVNGKLVIKDGKHTGALPGKILRKR